MYNSTHRFVVDFALYPGNNIQVGKSTGLETVGLEVFDLLQEFFKLRLELPGGNGDGMPQELEHGFLNGREIFHLGHKAEDGFGQGFHEHIIAEFIVGQQVHQACITLQVIAQVIFIVDDFLQVIDTGIEIAAAEIQHGEFVI